MQKYFIEEKKRNDSRKKRDKRYRETHKEERKIYSKLWRENNKDKVEEYELKRRKFQKKYGYFSSFRKEKEINLEKCINSKIARNLRTRLYLAIKNNFKIGSAVKDLGCTISELKIHLESKFQEGMSWENWSRTGWHIDHIIPLTTFNLQNREEFLKACHYTNLQPLWAEENFEKRKRIK